MCQPSENTDFKAGFCGVPPDFGKARIDYLSNSRKIRLAGYYAKEFLSNIAYINGSLVDTATAFFILSRTEAGLLLHLRLHPVG